MFGLNVAILVWKSKCDNPGTFYMTDYFLDVPSQKFPVPKITKQTKSHSLNFNVLSSVIDSSGEEVWVSFDSDNYFYVKTWFE